jgi:hypothetical protein
VVLNDALNTKFPKLLLGPILRRAEPKQVCVWVACSLPVSIKAEVFRFSDVEMNRKNKKLRPWPIGFGLTKSVKLGEHLHIALVIARPIALEPDQESAMGSGFPSDTLLAYDIEIIEGNSAESKGKRLSELGLTSGRNSIVYEDSIDGELDKTGMLPTFFLRAKDGQFNIMHGSCRKLHGKGEDCLVAADELISTSPTNLSKRPSALFLTGDQIYADDVAEPLAHYLTELGITLLGWEERIRGVNKGLSEIRPGERQKVIREYASFTAGHAGNHLLGFGEFAAMYMLAWSAENWPDVLANAPEIPVADRIKYRGQVKQLEGARRDLAAVRRVLANTPTYMIFDDHEITDDWNITREWYDNVADSRCGKQIVTNGLAAYWAIQGWGNDPALYNDAFIRRIVDYFGKHGNVTDVEKETFEDFLWNFHGWTVSAPTNPLTILVDSRTQRHYDTFKGAPQLIGEEGLLSISRTAEDANFKKGEAIIIVVPTPVLGFYLIEALQKAISLMTSIYAMDLESWFANTAGRIRFLTFLLQTLTPKHCIFLSGDVHFGFTNKAAFAPLQEGYGYDDVMSITQLNSSALKTTSLVKIAFVSEILARIRQMFPFKRLVRTGRLSYIRSIVGRQHPDWVEARAIVPASGSIVPPLIISDNNLGLVTIDENMSRIIHKLLVRKAAGKIKVHEAIVTTKDGGSPLEESVRARISKFVLKSSTLPP